MGEMMEYLGIGVFSLLSTVCLLGAVAFSIDFFKESYDTVDKLIGALVVMLMLAVAYGYAYGAYHIILDLPK